MPEVRVEVLPTTPSGDLAPRGPTIEDLRDRAVELADAVRQVAEKFKARLDQAGPMLSPDQVQLTFGMSLEAETGVVIARASAGAQFSAQITWSNK